MKPAQFSVFGALILILGGAAENGCASRRPAARAPVAAAPRVNQAPPTPSSDAARRLDEEAQRLLRQMQKQGASAAQPAIQGAIGTAGKEGDAGSTATTAIGANDTNAATGNPSDMGVSKGSGSRPPGTSPSRAAALAGALVVAAVALAGIYLVMRPRGRRFH